MITLALFAEELWKQFLVKNKYKQWIPQVKENSPTSSRENCYKNVSSKLQWVKVLLKQLSLHMLWFHLIKVITSYGSGRRDLLTGVKCEDDHMVSDI